MKMLQMGTNNFKQNPGKFTTASAETRGVSNKIISASEYSLK